LLPPKASMDSHLPPSKPHRVSPGDMKIPQGAWQEEESLEVYRRKRTQRPTEGAPEIVRFVKRHPSAAPTPFEVCPYRPPLAADETASREDVSGRAPSKDGLETPYRRSEREGELTAETPILDRTIYYEREVVQGEKTSDRGSRHPSRQTLDVDDEISQTNRRVDSVFHEYGSAAPRSPQPSVQSSVQERRVEERRSFEEKMSSKREHIKRVERSLEPPKAHSEKRGSFAAAETGPQRSRDSSYVSDYRKYERSTFGPPSRPISAARSTHTASERSGHSQYDRHRDGIREHEKTLMHERKTTRDVPIYTHAPPRRDEPPPRRISTSHAGAPPYRKDVDGDRRPPITEIITTERFERIERVRRRFPATSV
uniref:SDP_N domain-containing protein n=1 Tax=Haemonchus placei TaxID=6290 RepID=A0A0N4X8T1_HAEPC